MEGYMVEAGVQEVLERQGLLVKVQMVVCVLLAQVLLVNSQALVQELHQVPHYLPHPDVFAGLSLLVYLLFQ
jgi:hypothetical protein